MRKLLPPLLVALALVAALYLGSEREPGQNRTRGFAGSTMGTGYSVRLGDGEVAELGPLQQRVEGELARVDRLMSTWREDSELSRFNASTSADWFPVSAATAQVVQAALDHSRETDGALDITVGPLVDLWGFGPRARPATPPSDAAISAALERTGAGLVSVRLDPPALRKERGDVQVDLSAIAKGWGVDRLATIMADAGVDDFLVEIGGELHARGARDGGGPWRVAVERPDAVQRSVQRILAIGDGGLATSGDYRNYFEHQGVRYAHVIDGRTGRPVRQTIASVTVLADTTMDADALATALMVMGAEDALAYAEASGLAVHLIERTSDGFRERSSTALLPHLLETSDD